MTMKIGAWEYNFLTDSFDIFISGCLPPHCEGCFNSELWDFDKGVLLNNFLNNFRDRLSVYKEFVNNISVLGGEPLDQERNELMELSLELFNLKEPHVKLWLYTRYSFLDVSDEIKEIYDYIKCGRFSLENETEDNYQYGIKLASSNQKIYKKGVDYGFQSE